MVAHYVFVQTYTVYYTVAVVHQRGLWSKYQYHLRQRNTFLYRSNHDFSGCDR